MSNKKTRDMVLCAIFSALIIVMTIVPFTGYISYGTAIEITTLHIVVTLGAILLGWKYGAALGGVWGLTCIARAFTNPLWAPFRNPLISLLPRIIVGLVAGAAFMLARRKKIPGVLSAVIAAVLATLTNTALVLTSLNLFGGMTGDFFMQNTIFKQIWMTLIAVNGVLELGAAVILAPALYTAISRQDKRLESGK